MAAANTSSNVTHFSNVAVGVASGTSTLKVNNVGIHPTTSSTTSAADSLAIPITHRYVAKTTGADAEALTLANGTQGQELTITLVTDGNGDGTLTPATSTQFGTIVFADAGDTANLYYVDDTVGWIITGLFGLSAQPVHTAA